MLTRRRLLCFTLAFGGFGLVAWRDTRAASKLSTPAPATAPSTRPTSGPAKNPLVGKMQAYYAKLYEKPLTQKVRLARLVGVISLSRVDGPPLTQALLHAARDEDVLVGQMAWEALHARQMSLEGADRIAWLDAGFDLARRGGFPGATIAPLISALSERPASSYKMLPDLLLRIANENDPARESGRKTLDAARDSVARWQDPKSSQMLVSRVTSNAKHADRLMRILGGLPGAPEANEDASKSHSQWSRFARELKLTAPAELPRYQGVSAVFPAPLAIIDPLDKKWQKELELENLKVEKVEIVYCIDATPSMEVSNPLVAAYVETISGLFETMSYSVKSGAVYYRHEIDDSIKAECCKKVKTTGDDFAVKVFQLTARPQDLVSQMRGMKIGGKGTGHAGNGAYVAGIQSATHTITWSTGSKRVIAMTGDARATPGSADKLLEVSKKAKADGYALVFIARDEKAANVVSPASFAAMGLEPILYGDDIKKIQAAKGSDTTAEFQDTAFEEMSIRVLQQSLPGAYRDRARSLVTAIIPILQAKVEVAKTAAAK